MSAGIRIVPSTLLYSLNIRGGLQEAAYTADVPIDWHSFSAIFPEKL